MNQRADDEERETDRSAGWKKKKEAANGSSRSTKCRRLRYTIRGGSRSGPFRRTPVELPLIDRIACRGVES